MVEKANKNEPVGHEAKLRNARLSYYIGEYGWAEGQLDILKAATSKLIANDAIVACEDIGGQVRSRNLAEVKGPVRIGPGNTNMDSFSQDNLLGYAP